MFFLLRAAFWLSLVILLIPADPADKPAASGRTVSTMEAVGAAQSTLDDVKGFCGRNPSACDVGRMALDTFSAKARTGARWVYQQLEAGDATATGSTPSPAAVQHVDRATVAPMPVPRPLS